MACGADVGVVGSGRGLLVVVRLAWGLCPGSEPFCNERNESEMKWMNDAGRKMADGSSQGGVLHPL